MKKLLFSIAFMCAMFSNAQTLETKSSCDSDADGKVEVTDVTNTTRKLLGQAAKEKQVVTADDLNALLKKINSRLSAIEAKLGIEYTEPADPEYENGYEYVDLGLSVKWATMNVGATEVAGSKINSHTGELDCYGEYYAWGETSPKDKYYIENYKYAAGMNEYGIVSSFTKYVTSSDYGTIDNKYILELSDDAARANWGGSWRMPTSKELRELTENCYWEWTTSYDGSGVKGYIVYKVKNDSDKGKVKNSSDTPTLSASYSLGDTHIFLPASGNNSSGFGSNGCYWSSSLSSNSEVSSYLLFRSNILSIGPYYRHDGLSVRPVCP